MTVDEILTLAKAGFTAEQIAAMNPTSVPAPQPEPPAPAPKDDPEPHSFPTPAQTDLAPVLAEIKSLREAIQAQAAHGSQFPAQQSVDDILAGIIDPSINRK